MGSLNDILTVFDVEVGPLSRIDKTSPWALRFGEYEQFRIGAVLSGKLWLLVDNAAPRKLSAGDCYLLGDGNSYIIGSDLTTQPSSGDAVVTNLDDEKWPYAGGAPEDPNAVRSVLLCGSLRLDDVTGPLLQRRLPAYREMKSGSQHSRVVRAILELLCDEASWEIPHAKLMRFQLSRVLLIQLVRTALLTADGFAATASVRSFVAMDERIRHVLDVIHRRPSERWTVAELAAAVNMSRSAFAARFRSAVGLPPLEYLELWRIRSAAAVLQSTNRTVSSVATQFGYSADSTFSRAFKRVTGYAPQQYRHRHLAADLDGDAVPVSDGDRTRAVATDPGRRILRVGGNGESGRHALPHLAGDRPRSAITRS
ncbi:AraC family transcriptional regulator [Streptomyces tendae]|uniref:AraC family transcriptional regulator n=1 Tax=Streptomyces tendae TaxID=1932 RepID=UPI00367665C5